MAPAVEFCRTKAIPSAMRPTGGGAIEKVKVVSKPATTGTAVACHIAPVWFEALAVSWTPPPRMRAFWRSERPVAVGKEG